MRGFSKKTITHRSPNVFPLSRTDMWAISTLASHMGKAYARIRYEAPYLHDRTSYSASFVYFTTLNTKVAVLDKLRHPGVFNSNKNMAYDLF